NSKQSEPRQDRQALLYSSYMQAEDTGEMMVYLRGSLPPEQLFAAARESVLKLDPNLPIFNMRSLESQFEASLTSERLLSFLTSAFGLLATLLAAIGLYGVLAFLVASRTKEIGVRMALGAEPVRVVMLVFRDVGWMVALGVLVALPLCYLLGTALQSQLYGVEPWDPAAIASASLVLLGAAACAGAIPAAIAARVDPMAALRNE
ncbi:MAG: multidrug ABC transporter substrate-binding protein, partial [Bryobacterales bacterium]|nr:multidrug ABC transporter substrate-binding protein [Bryobacterales bacterium]